MAEQFYRRYREMMGSAGDRDRNRMRDFARCLACNDKTTEGLKVLEKAFVNVLDAAGEKLDLCVWCGEKTIAGNILTSWPEKIELLGKIPGIPRSISKITFPSGMVWADLWFRKGGHREYG